MRVPFVDLTREWHSLEKELVDVFTEFGRSGQYVLGPYADRFETAFAEYCGYAHAVGVSTGLAALEVALRAYEVGPGDEVITVGNSAVATALAISSVGATPIFCDIGTNFLMDPSKIEQCITNRTKAILPVHLFGKICDMSSINAIAKEHSLIVVEDACQAHGAAWEGESAVNTKAFSFYPTKNLGAFGEGGMVVTNDERVKKFTASYRNYGQEGRYNHVHKGTNYRIHPLQCALMQVKLNTFDTFIQKRRDIAKKYITNLSDLSWLTLPEWDKSASYHLFVIRVKEDMRDQLKKYLEEQGIETLVHYPKTIYVQPCYAEEYSSFSLEMTEQYQKEILSLPCYPFLQAGELEHIISTLLEYKEESVVISE